MLQRITNFTIIAACVICAVAVVKNAFFSTSIPSANQVVSSLRGQQVRFNGSLDRGVSVVLAVSSHCQYCRKSLPFYQKISSWRSSAQKFGFIAVGVENQADLANYLSANQIQIDSVQLIPKELTISGTPTFLLLKDGVVVEAWVGLLDQSGEASFARALKGVCPSCKIRT